MDELYKLIEVGKTKQRIESDRGYAIANGINPQVIVDLKAGKSLPNAINMLKILSAAGLDVNDGIKAIEKQREAGFANIDILIGLSSLSLVGVGGMLYSPALAGLTAIGCGAIYIIRSKC